TLVGADKVDDESCGNPEDVSMSSNQYQLESQPQITVLVKLPQGVSPTQKTEKAAILGQPKETLDEALDAWEEKCFAALSEKKASLGDRYLGGHCPNTKDISQYSNRYEVQSDMVVYIRPLQ